MERRRTRPRASAARSPAAGWNRSSNPSSLFPTTFWFLLQRAAVWDIHSIARNEINTSSSDSSVALIKRSFCFDGVTPSDPISRSQARRRHRRVLSSPEDETSKKTKQKREKKRKKKASLLLLLRMVNFFTRSKSIRQNFRGKAVLFLTLKKAKKINQGLDQLAFLTVRGGAPM